MTQRYVVCNVCMHGCLCVCIYDVCKWVGTMCIVNGITCSCFVCECKYVHMCFVHMWACVHWIM